MPVSANCVVNWTHSAGIVTFVSPAEAVDPTSRLDLSLPGIALVDVQPGGGHVDDKETNQVTEIDLKQIVK